MQDVGRCGLQISAARGLRCGTNRTTSHRGHLLPSQNLAVECLPGWLDEHAHRLHPDCSESVVTLMHKAAEMEHEVVTEDSVFAA